MNSILNVIGFASAAGGRYETCAQGPITIQQHLSKLDSGIDWAATVYAPKQIADHYQAVASVCHELAVITESFIKDQKKFCVLGGDHTCAIGTWSGVAHALRAQGDIGLIWLDAHMDSHTPETTPSERIHGMPLACLLGAGPKALTDILDAKPKLKPENVVLVGVRSFEEGEANFLAQSNVRVYFMEEVKKRGLQVVMQEAKKIVSKRTVGFGLSLDLDGLDPNDAPGVDVPVPNGVSATEMQAALKELVADKNHLATEIVEFDPTYDRNQITEKLIISLLEILRK